MIARTPVFDRVHGSVYDQSNILHWVRTTGNDFLTGEKVEELFGEAEGGRLAEDAAERERLANLR